MAECWLSIAYAGIYIVGDFESTFPNKGASTCGTDGHSTFWPIICVIFCQKARHWLPSWSHHRLQWLPSQRPLHRWHGKVTGAAQKLVSAVNRIRLGLASACSVKKLSAHDFPLKSSSQMASSVLTWANSFLVFSICTNHQFSCIDDNPCLLCFCVCL